MKTRLESIPRIVKRKNKSVFPAIIQSDFRREVGDVANIIEFANNFLDRYPSDKQTEFLIAFAGDKGGEWNTDYHEFVLPVGMKGGKNFVAEIVVSYVAYFISCLVDPHEYFTKITKRGIKYTLDKTFDIVNVSSVDESQARKVFFDTVKSVLRLTKDPKTGERWFEKFARLDLRKGGFGDIKERIIAFPSKIEGAGSVRFMSFNSTATAPEGAHFLIFLADELSRADTKAKYREAKKLLDLGLKNTAVSFKNKVGKVLEWSYLNDTDFDLTYDRYLESLKNPKIWGRLYTTYDFNPTITREELKDEYDTDETTAKRIYECIKPKSRDNFFQPYINKIKEAVAPDIDNKVTYKQITVSRETERVIDGKAVKKTYQFTGVEIINIIGDNKPRCFALDPSKVKDRFTIVGGYLETIDPFRIELFVGDQKEVIDVNAKPIIDFILVIEPEKSKPVDYMSVGKIIEAILRNFPNTQSINSDHFQNEKLRQEIISKGISAETYFFSNTMQLKLYTELRANVWNNNIAFCADRHELMFMNRKMSLTDLLVFEAETIIKDGNKIDHPDYGSKDVIDDVAIVNHDLMNLEVLGINEDVETFTDEKLVMFAKQYMTHKYELVQQNMPEDQIDVLLKEKLNLKDGEYRKLKKYVRDYYNY